MTTEATPIDNCIDFAEDGRLCNWTPQPATPVPTSETVSVTSLPNTGSGPTYGGDIALLTVLIAFALYSIGWALIARSLRLTTTTGDRR